MKRKVNEPEERMKGAGGGKEPGKGSRGEEESRR